MPLPELRSPLARAVVPVLGGIGVLALLALVTWGIAANIEPTESLAPSTLELGGVEPRAEEIAENGPLLLPDPTSSAERNIVVNHIGGDATTGWRVYFAYPKDRDESCPVRQERGTATFIDCDGRTIEVAELALPPRGVSPVVRDSRTLSINLRGAIADSTTTATG